MAKLFLNDEVSPLTKFSYDKYDLTPELREKRRGRDIFVHLKDGNRRIIVTNHPQGTPNKVKEEIIRILLEDD